MRFKSRKVDGYQVFAITGTTEDDGWLKQYKPGSLKQKRVEMFKRIEGFEQA